MTHGLEYSYLIPFGVHIPLRILSITSGVLIEGSGETIPAMVASPTEATTLPAQSFTAPIPSHLCEEAVKKLLSEDGAWVTTAGSYSLQAGCRLTGSEGLNVQCC